MKVFDPKPDNNFVDGPGHGSFIEEPIYDPLVAVEQFKKAMHHGRKRKECGDNENDDNG